jgi:hypothetical protein
VLTLETLDVNTSKKGLRVREGIKEREMIIVGGVDVGKWGGRVEGVRVKGVWRRGRDVKVRVRIERIQQLSFIIHF